MVPEARFWLFLEVAGYGFGFTPNRPSWGVIVCTLGHIFNLDVLLDPEEDVSHLGNFVLH